MKKELRESFNTEVERYRKALLFYAKKADWETFKNKAGSLFDYLESIEISEVQKRFFLMFRLIFACLAVLVIFIFSMDFQVSAEIFQYRTPALLVAATIGCFELYFYVKYRRYMQVKARFYEKRRERFVINIEHDFREMAIS